MILTPADYVVDTSVVVKWFWDVEEPDADKARLLRNAFIDGACRLRAPDLLLVELANALVTGQRAKSDKVNAALEAVREMELDIQQFRWQTLVRAIQFASLYGVTVHDAYFLAVAAESRSILITADERFIKKVGRHPNLVSLRGLRKDEIG